MHAIIQKPLEVIAREAPPWNDIKTSREYFQANTGGGIKNDLIGIGKSSLRFPLKSVLRGGTIGGVVGVAVAVVKSADIDLNYIIPWVSGGILVDMAQQGVHSGYYLVRRFIDKYSNNDYKQTNE